MIEQTIHDMINMSNRSRLYHSQFVDMANQYTGIDV